jgi:hypothetical protein
MYASAMGSRSSATMAANDRRVWNDALQAAVLALACDRPDPMRSSLAANTDPCIDCQHKECARELIIKCVLELKR